MNPLTKENLDNLRAYCAWDGQDEPPLGMHSVDADELTLYLLDEHALRGARIAELENAARTALRTTVKLAGERDDLRARLEKLRDALDRIARNECRFGDDQDFASDVLNAVGTGFPVVDCNELARMVAQPVASAPSDLPSGWRVCGCREGCAVYGDNHEPSVCVQPTAKSNAHRGAWFWENSEGGLTTGHAPTMLQAMTAALGIRYAQDAISGNYYACLPGSPDLVRDEQRIKSSAACARAALEAFHAQHAQLDTAIEQAAAAFEKPRLPGNMPSREPRACISRPDAWTKPSGLPNVLPRGVRHPACGLCAEPGPLVHDAQPPEREGEEHV